jgi:coenzyme Q-binding protein COQ10
MPSFATRRNVPFTPEQMFNLVADVEKYPGFLPLCESLEVTDRRTDGEGRPVLVANMTCGYKAIRESFVSRVTLDREQHHIIVEYVDGPFRHLRNDWVFARREGGCQIKFDIVYEFKSMMLGLLVGALFDKAFRKFAAAFEQRAHVIYGRQAREDGGDGAVAITDPTPP